MGGDLGERVFAPAEADFDPELGDGWGEKGFSEKLPLPLRAWAAKRTEVGGRGPRGTIRAATPPTPALPLKGGGG
jgi:hypothetical protein